jgi:predicted nucleic acid-binding protein
MNWEEVGTLVRDTITMCPKPQALTYQSYMEAVRISKRYGFSIWDGAILACALEAGCGILYTEDLQHGQIIEGLRIENPFL